MKRVFTLAFFIFLFSYVTVTSQTVPNGDFENWSISTSYEEPQGYTSFNSMMAILGNTAGVTKTTDSYSGTYAAKLTTTLVQGDTTAALLTTGTFDKIAQGIPYTSKPDTIRLHAKHSMAPGDTAIAHFIFTYNTNVIGVASIRFFDTLDTYTEFKQSVMWFTPTTVMPDSLSILITSQDFQYGNGTPGSFLIMDNLNLGAGINTIPNPDFELWDSFQSEEADFWYSVNSFVSPSTPAVQKTTDAYEGSYAAKIKNVETMFGDTMGFFTNGRLGDDGPEGGLAVDANPHKITGYYKYSPNGPDTALVGAFSYAWNNSTSSLEIVDSNIVLLPASSTFQPFELMLNYDSWPIVDTLNITFASGNFLEDQNYVGLGSELIVDSINVIYKPVAIESKVQNKIRIWPNPVSEIVQIEIQGQTYSSLTCYSIEGQILKTKEIKDNAYLTLNVSEFPSGLVLLRLEGNHNTLTKKIIIK